MIPLASVLAAALAAAGGARADAGERLRLLLEREAAGLAARVEIEVGALDARIDLSRCERLEPFLPQGARLWGRSWVGVRCGQGASASTHYLPVQVRLWGPALVAARPLAAGLELTSGDVRLEEVELTREAPGQLVADPAQIPGKTLRRPLRPGEPLRADLLAARPAVAAGDAVRIVYAGHGFTVSTEGRALASAAEGGAVRVQTASGRTLTGTARGGRLVEVSD